MHVAVRAHRLGETHVRRLFEQGVVQQIAHVDQQRADDDRLPHEHEQLRGGHVLEQQGAERERDVRDHRHRQATDLASREAAPPVPPHRRRDQAGRAALEQWLEDGDRRQVVDPVARGQVRGQPSQRAGECDE